MIINNFIIASWAYFQQDHGSTVSSIHGQRGEMRKGVVAVESPVRSDPAVASSTPSYSTRGTEHGPEHAGSWLSEVAGRRWLIRSSSPSICSLPSYLYLWFFGVKMQVQDRQTGQEQYGRTPGGPARIRWPPICYLGAVDQTSNLFESLLLTDCICTYWFWNWECAVSN